MADLILTNVLPALISAVVLIVLWDFFKSLI